MDLLTAARTCFSRDYAESRRRFVRAARVHGAVLKSYVNPNRGPAGEPIQRPRLRPRSCGPLPARRRLRYGMHVVLPGNLAKPPTAVAVPVAVVVAPRHL